MMWKLEFSKNSLLFLRSLDQDSQKKIGKALNRFLLELNNPEQPKLSDIKALKGKKGEFRLRVGNFRVRLVSIHFLRLEGGYF
jgi:mRNA-degrading endonuclease RelE of RelBE toxin-antitoxin system